MENLTEFIALCICCCILFTIIWIPYKVILIIKKRKRSSKNEPQIDKEENTLLTAKDYQNYSQAYEPKYLMTINEKAQFRKLQNWAHKNGYYIFTKVRLLDLITPRNDISNYKGALWKIQAKHVDFLICDKSISVKYIIEIDDNSHKQTDRIERDKFVVEVLRACGYKVLQTYNITDEQLNDIYKSINPQPMSEPIIPE